MKTPLISATIHLLAITRVIATPGNLDQTFAGNADGTVRSIAAQPDGKLVVGGEFSFLGPNSELHNRIGRLNAEGQIDHAFNPSVDFGLVFSVAVQADGRILISGSFTSVNGIGRKYVARLNPSGSLDTSFDVGAGPDAPVYCVATGQGGKVLIGGAFANVAGVTRSHLARLNSDGSLDTTFNNGTGANGLITCITPQPDGKILIGGSFTSVNQVSWPFVARLNSDESLDPNFSTGSGANGQVTCIALQNDGEILLGGYFSQINNTIRPGVVRLHSDGSIDYDFAPNNLSFNPSAMAVQVDGKILIGGSSHVGGSTIANAIRLNPAGSSDASFASFSANGGGLFAFALQPTGKLVVGGGFSGNPASNLARLRGDAPFIDLQPASQVVLPGGISAFAVSASGIEILSYQWHQNGTNIPGATSSSLTITNVQPEQTGNYSVTITNFAGFVNSSAASLSLYGAPTTLSDGQIVAGSVTRNYSSVITLQTSFPGGYVFYTLDGSTPGFFSPLYTAPFTITNSATIRAVSLALDFSESFPGPPAQIVIQKYALTLSGGGGYIDAEPAQPLYEDGAFVTLTALPDAGWAFQDWQGDLAGTNNPVPVVFHSSEQVEAIFTTSAVTNTLGAGHIDLSAPGPFAYGSTIQIRAIPALGNIFVVWGGAMSGTANPQTFTVNSALPNILALFTTGAQGIPTITTQPLSRITSAGSSVTLSVGTCCGSYTYQWRLNGIPIVGATNSSISVTNLGPTLLGDYDVVVTGGGVSIASSAAKVMIMDFNMRPVVSVLGNPGTPFRVEYSDSLSNGTWFLLTNGILPSTRQDIIDFSNTNSQKRFYRVVLPR